MKQLKVPYKKYKLGDMIYPIDNESGFWFFGWGMKWGVVDQVKKGLSFKNVRWFSCIDCANLYSELIIKNVIQDVSVVKEKTQ